MPLYKRYFRKIRNKTSAGMKHELDRLADQVREENRQKMAFPYQKVAQIIEDLRLERRQ
jgi:hypothetical protein